jgi:hypothetical protein
MPPRRKQKPPEYEDDPVFSPPKIEDEPHERVATMQTKPTVIPDKPDGDLPVMGDNTAKTRGFDEVWGKVANKYRPPPIISPPKVPERLFETDENPLVYAPKVTNVERIVTVPTDEVVEGWGKVFGHKEKEVKTVKDREA